MINARETDHFVVSKQELKALATDRIIRRGMSYFQDGRVLSCAVNGRHLRAVVQGQESTPYELEIEARDGEFEIDCSCAFEWEPACKHAIAAILEYSVKQSQHQDLLKSAEVAEIKKRRKRGIDEVSVTLVDAENGFGLWTAQSNNQYQKNSSKYRLEIRSLSETLNYCECRDFQANLLGTCKHIEAAIHEIKKSLKPAPTDTCSPTLAIDWQYDAGPRPVLLGIKADQISQFPALEEFFDSSLQFKLDGMNVFELDLEKLESMVEAAQNSEGLRVGIDLTRFMSQLRKRKEQEVRQSQLQAELKENKGKLPGLRATLFDYQVEGMAFLAANGRAILADDMGLGKSIQAIAATLWLKTHGGLQRALIVCPASLKNQWDREVRRFTDLKTVVIDGSKSVRKQLYQRSATVFIVNYELVVRDLELLARTFQPDLVILDEAQRIRNWRTKTAAAIKALPSRYAFVLTGTPLENRLEDLYSLMQVIDSRILGPLWRFMLDFHLKDHSGKVIGYKNLAELRTRLGRSMLRRERDAVADQLPERQEQRRDVELDKHQREFHDKALQTIAVLSAKRSRGKMSSGDSQKLLAAFTRARMSCNAAGLIDPNIKGSPKLSELKSLLEETVIDAGQKVVVFTEWGKMSVLVDEVAQELELSTLRLTGKVPSNKRAELIRRFETSAEHNIFISTDAGATGLNLQCASVLINLDIPWNPAILDQRLARVYRLGQKKPVSIIHIHSAESYESKVHDVVARKRMLFQTVVTGESDQDILTLSDQALDVLLAPIEPKIAEKPSKKPGKTLKKVKIKPDEPEIPFEKLTSAQEKQFAEFLDMALISLGSRYRDFRMNGDVLTVIVDFKDFRERRLRTMAPPDVNYKLVSFEELRERESAEKARIDALKAESLKLEAQKQAEASMLKRDSGKVATASVTRRKIEKLLNKLADARSCNDREALKQWLIEQPCPDEKAASAELFVLLKAINLLEKEEIEVERLVSCLDELQSYVKINS